MLVPPIGNARYPTSSGFANLDRLAPLPQSTGTIKPAVRPGVSAQAVRRPEVYVFDSFSGQSVDINGDGLGDVDHGDIVAAIVSGQTNVPVNKVQMEWNAPPERALAVLDQLGRRADVSNLYLNFSVSTGDDKAIYQRLLGLAKRGAHIYIAAGNTEANRLANAGPPHRNIHVVGASSGVVGSSRSSRALETFKSKQITEVVNGRVIGRSGASGTDITKDGRADLAPNRVQKIQNDAAGRPLKEVDLGASIAKSGRLPVSEDLVRANGVVRIGQLRKAGLLSAPALQVMQRGTGLPQAQLDSLYVHAGYLSLYETSFGDAGGIVLYRASASGMQTVRQKIDLGSATSWATPNAVARDVQRALNAGGRR